MSHISIYESVKYEVDIFLICLIKAFTELNWSKRKKTYFGSVNCFFLVFFKHNVYPNRMDTEIEISNAQDDIK